MRRCCVALALLVLPGLSRADEEKGKPILVLNSGGHTGRIRGLAFTRDGKELISVGEDKTVRFWNVETGEARRVLRLPLGVDDRAGPGGGSFALALAGDGKLLAVAGRALAPDRHWIYLISPNDGRLVQVLRGGHEQPILAVSLSRDGKWLASGGVDSTVRLWDIKTGKNEVIHSPPTDKPGFVVLGVAISPDGRSVAFSKSGKNVYLWTAANGQTKVIHEGRKEKEPVHDLAWSPDGKTLAGMAHTRVVHLWNADGSKRADIERDGAGLGLSFSSNSQFLVAGGNLLDLTAGKQVQVIGQRTAGGRAMAAALAPGGRVAAWGGQLGDELLIWNVSTPLINPGDIIHHLGSRGKSVVDVAWSPNGKTVAWEYVESEAEVHKRRGRWRAFDLAGLRLLPAPDPETYQHAQHALGDLTLEKSNALTWTLKRGKEAVRTIELPRGPGLDSLATFLGRRRGVFGRPNGLFLYDLDTGNQLRTFQGIGGVRGVAAAPGNRYFAAGSIDQVLRIYTPNKEEPLLSLFVAGADWVAWTPAGYYAASPGGEQLMGWQINNGPGRLATFHPCARFRRSLHRPDVIARLLETGDAAKALELADKDRGKPTQHVEIGQVLPPTVTIVSPQQSVLEVKDAKVVVKAVAESAGPQPITSMQLMLDGRPYEGQRGIRALRPEEKSRAEKEWTVELTPGTHFLSVVALTPASKATSDLLEVSYRPAVAPPPSDTRPGLYVLAVGIDAYPGDLRLACAANDAKELEQSFKKHSPSLFREVKTKLLLDKEATRAGILGGFQWLKDRVKSHDVAIIFYAGHGHKDQDGRFFLLSVDMDPSRLAETAVTGEELKKQLSDLPGRVLLMLDACHAGAIGAKIKNAAAGTDDLARELADEDCGVVMMCAAMGKEESREDDAVKHGFFTLALIEGLSGKADYDKDGFIHLTELDLYIGNRVVSLSKDLQHPVVAKPTTIRSFALAKP